MSDVISKVEEGSTYDINGVVTAVCTVGFILTDNSGSIFSYMPKGYDPATYPVGTQLVVKALIGSYNLGFQIDGSNSTFEAKGTVEQVEYPATHVFTVEELEAIGARSENAVAQYGSMSGEIVVGEKNINILVGSDKVQGSLYNATDDIKAALANGETMTVTGYVIAVAGKGKYINMVASIHHHPESGRLHRHGSEIRQPFGHSQAGGLSARLSEAEASLCAGRRPCVCGLQIL